VSIKTLFWGAYALFVALALFFSWHDGVVSFSGPLAAVELLVWVAFIGFLAYSIYCSAREDLIQSVAKLSELHWGRQIGADLYLGLLLALLIVFLNSGALAVALWAIPTLLFGNLSILLYFALHFDAIVARFLA
jgi:hypothetical protein